MKLLIFCLFLHVAFGQLPCYCFPSREEIRFSYQNELSDLYYAENTCDEIADTLSIGRPLSDIELISALAVSHFQSFVCNEGNESLCNLMKTSALDYLAQTMQAIQNIGTLCSCT
jgi:hypothetical protein